MWKQLFTKSYKLSHYRQMSIATRGPYREGRSVYKACHHYDQAGEDAPQCENQGNRHVTNRLRKHAGWPVWLAFVAVLIVVCFLAWRKEPVKKLGPNRDRISLSTQELVRVSEKRPTGQGVTPVQSYHGKWMEVSGTIAAIGPWGDGSTGLIAVTLRVTEGDEATGPNNPFVVAKFDKKWAEALSGLHQGDKIKVMAQIYWVERTGVWLEHGELR
jgi:hypothetical protein